MRRAAALSLTSCRPQTGCAEPGRPEVGQSVLERRVLCFGVKDPGHSPGAATTVLCDVDKLLTLVEVPFLQLLFEG